jgi:hypothetical protein
MKRDDPQNCISPKRVDVRVAMRCRGSHLRSDDVEVALFYGFPRWPPTGCESVEVQAHLLNNTYDAN